MSSWKRIGFVTLVALMVLGPAMVVSHRTDRLALETRLKDAGVPGDLPDYVGQLRSLSLPSGVRDYGWLDDGLEVLSVGRLEPADLPALPKRLRTLEVRDASELESLDRLPSKLERLSLPLGSVGRLGRLPESLDEVVLPAVEDLDFGALPSSVSGVEIMGSKVRGLFDLPRGVSSLGLEGRGVETLDGMPAEVVSLSLRSTAIDSLDPLPATLQALELVDNGRLRPIQASELPAYLVELTLVSQTLHPQVTLPESLLRLRLRSTNAIDEDGETLPVNKKLLERFPSTLVELELEQIEQLKDEPESGRCLPLPSGLKFLSLSMAAELDASCLPDHLEELYFIGDVPIETLRALDPTPKSLGMTGRLDLKLLPRVLAALKRLDLAPAEGSDLRSLSNASRLRILVLRRSFLKVIPDLPVHLQVLDLSGSPQLESLGQLGRQVPRLQVLDLSGTPLSSLEGLPPGLRFLDIAGTMVSDLKGLPPKLESLTLSSGRVESLEGLPASVRHLSFVEE